MKKKQRKPQTKCKDKPTEWEKKMKAQRPGLTSKYKQPMQINIKKSKMGIEDLKQTFSPKKIKTDGRTHGKMLQHH